MKILIIDDDADIVKMLEMRIKPLGHETLTGSTGQEAISKAKSGAPNLIIMDINIPEPNGVEVATQLKADPATKNIPIILLSGQSHEGSTGGAEALVEKPYEWDTLKQKIESLLK